MGSNGENHRKTRSRDVVGEEKWVESAPDILIVGPYPPPAGGVSRHIARCVPLLIQQGLTVRVLSHYGRRPDVPYVVSGLRRNPLRYFTRIRASKARLVHYHYSTLTSLIAAAFGLATRRRCARVITVHSPTIVRDLQRWPLPLGRLAQWSLRQFDHVIAVTAEIDELLRPLLPDHPISVIPAYVPQVETDELPPAMASFVNSGDVFVAAAWRLKIPLSGEDLYGFDILARAFLKVAAVSSSARLVLLVGEEPGWRGKRYLRSVRTLLDNGALGGRYMIAQGVDLASLLTREVILVRPTRSDGDAVSIREALSNSRRVIATDVVVRPAGVRLIPAGDVAALASAMEENILSPRAGRAALIPRETDDLDAHFARLLGVYRRYLE